MAQIDQADMPGKMRVDSSFLKDIIISVHMFLCLEQQLLCYEYIYLKSTFEEFQNATDHLVHFTSTCDSILVRQKKLGGFRIHGDLPHCALKIFVSSETWWNMVT